MYCKLCGKQIDDDSKFCSYCGGSQSAVNRAINEPSLKNEIHSNKELDKNKDGSIKVTANILGNLVKPSNEEGNEYQNQSKIESKQYNIRKKIQYQDEAIFIGVLLIGITISVSIFFQEYRQILLPFLIIIKILLTIWIVDLAFKLNRNRSFWGILGFLFTGIALIIIGLLRKKGIDHLQSGALNSQSIHKNETDKITRWECPKCKNSNPNVTFTCQNCNYTLR